MLYLLFTVSYLLDIIILVFFIVLILSLFKLIKSLGEKYTLAEKLRIAPELMLDKSAATFDKYAKKNKDGTYQVSFDLHKNSNRLLKRVIQGALGFFAIKIVIVSLILLNIPRLGEAQPKVYDAFYEAKNYDTFTKGSFTMSQWDDDGLTLQAGQFNGNYISQPIGDGQSQNQWKNLSWIMDNIYNQKPEYPKNTISVWGLDSLDNCTSQAYSAYKCETNLIQLTKGIYSSNAYEFDGYNSKVKIPKNLNFTGSFTIGAWIKPSVNIINGSEEQNYAILSKSFGDYSVKNRYEFRRNLFFGFKNGSLSLMFWSDDNKEHWVKAQNLKYNFEPGRWYHVAGVYDDKNKTLKLYIDGIEQTELVADYDEGKINHSLNLTKDNFPSWLGCEGYLWMDKEEKIINVFKGAIDEVFVANNAMGILDIRKLVNQSAEISLQVRTGDILPLGGYFIGPNNTSITYFTNPKNNDLSFLNPSKYLQYIIYLNRPNTNFEPKINRVNLDYTVTDSSDLKIAFNPAVNNNQNNFRDLSKEQNAIDIFIKYFKTLPQNDADWEFVHLVAYNTAAQRDLNAEVQAIYAFVKYLKRLPKSDLDWGLIKALAYSEKGKILQASWTKK